MAVPKWRWNSPSFKAKAKCNHAKNSPEFSTGLVIIFSVPRYNIHTVLFASLGSCWFTAAHYTSKSTIKTRQIHTHHTTRRNNTIYRLSLCPISNSQLDSTEPIVQHQQYRTPLRLPQRHLNHRIKIDVPTGSGSGRGGEAVLIVMLDWSSWSHVFEKMRWRGFEMG